MKKLFFSAVVSAAMIAGAPAHATGVPTVDAVLNGTAFMQLAELKASYGMLMQQYQQLQSSYAAITGSRGLGRLFYNPALRNALPADWRQVYDAVKSADMSSGSMSERQVAIIVRQRMTAEADQAVGLKGYQGAVGRLNVIENLMNAINGTADTKAAQDIIARFQAEQATIQNEQTKLQLISMLQAAERRQIEEQKRDLNRQLLNPDNESMPTIK